MTGNWIWMLIYILHQLVSGLHVDRVFVFACTGLQLELWQKFHTSVQLTTVASWPFHPELKWMLVSAKLGFMFTSHTRSDCSIGINCALQRLEPFSCPEFGLPLASGASRCSALQPGTVYLPRYEPPNCRWAPSSAYWRLSFSSMHEPSSGAVVTEQRVKRRIQISGLNSTQLNYSAKYKQTIRPTIWTEKYTNRIFNTPPNS